MLHGFNLYFAKQKGTFATFVTYWMWNKKKQNSILTNHVRICAQQTQDLIVQSDIKNHQQIKTLDENNEKRHSDVKTTIISEQRASFDVLSQQFYTVTQVALQTLNIVANTSKSKGKTNYIEKFE